MTRSGDAARHFEHLGVDYYVAGRAAVLALSFSPVCGNLFHHSIEMFLKAGLSRRFSLQELKKRFDHNLPRLWAAFKTQFPGAALNQFDEVVAGLDRFERLRYPDAVLAEGMSIAIQWEPGEWTSTSETPRYQLVVNDVDMLVAKIFEVCDLNPAFFMQGRLNEYGRDALTCRNPVAEFLAPETK